MYYITEYVFAFSHVDAGKCSKISSTFLFLFFKSNVGFRAGIHKNASRITNREVIDQTGLNWVCTVNQELFGKQLVFEI